MAPASDLSPAAQAVYNAMLKVWPLRIDEIAAAALRAAASTLREAYINEEYVDSADDWLDAIAAELESLPQ